MWYLIVPIPDLCTLTYFDTLPIQCRHIEHMHVGVIFDSDNLENDSNENLDNFSPIWIVYMHL